jgi:two-component system, OmpR family, response regulator TctD
MTDSSSESAPDADSPPPAGRELNVLCIDDDSSTLDSLRRSFRRRGIRVTCADNGREGLHLASTIRPDVIVTDLQMPSGSGSGPWLVQQLRMTDLTASIPIIVYSGRGLKGFDQVPDWCAVEMFFEKPTPFPRILDAVRFVAKFKSSYHAD